MTQALTRLLASTRRKKGSEYLPPYFWHRGVVWFAIHYLTMTLLPTALMLLYEGYTLWWHLLVSLVLWVLLLSLLRRIRTRWSERTMATLTDHLRLWAAHEWVDDFDFAEAITKLELLGREMRRYNAYSPFDSLSIRLSDWSGSGTKFTLYERRRPKREIVFYHD